MIVFFGGGVDRALICSSAPSQAWSPQGNPQPPFTDTSWPHSGITSLSHVAFADPRALYTATWSVASGTFKDLEEGSEEEPTLSLFLRGPREEATCLRTSGLSPSALRKNV